MYKKGIKGNQIDELNSINLKIQEKMLKEGNFYLHKFSLPDDKGIIKKGETLYPLRYMSGNDNISDNDLKNILNYIKEIGESIVK